MPEVPHVDANLKDPVSFSHHPMVELRQMPNSENPLLESGVQVPSPDIDADASSRMPSVKIPSFGKGKGDVDLQCPIRMPMHMKSPRHSVKTPSFGSGKGGGVAQSSSRKEDENSFDQSSKSFPSVSTFLPRKTLISSSRGEKEKS
eukprot:TRINITY_DN185_c0_g1_i1.p1 TRINITY_DN185_c0_g1~~TRINITY_DN185_c0_g1_i1.p1  ORF type:complete len:146 (+),score=20.87 TRINITY_DN185_c0_g1_i1:703-1140(+)